MSVTQNKFLKSQLKAQFQIKDWQETTQSEIDKDKNNKRTLANVSVEYSGDIVGQGELQYLLSYQIDGSAEFVGFEYIQASIHGASEHLTLRHVGTFVAGIASSQFVVIQSDLDASLIGCAGEFTSGENGQADFIIQLPVK
jgi:hypothetical protein